MVYAIYASDILQTYGVHLALLADDTAITRSLLWQVIICTTHHNIWSLGPKNGECAHIEENKYLRLDRKFSRKRHHKQDTRKQSYLLAICSQIYSIKSNVKVLLYCPQLSWIFGIWNSPLRYCLGLQYRNPAEILVLWVMLQIITVPPWCIRNSRPHADGQRRSQHIHTQHSPCR